MNNEQLFKEVAAFTDNLYLTTSEEQIVLRAKHLAEESFSRVLKLTPPTSPNLYFMTAWLLVQKDLQENKVPLLTLRQAG